MSLSFPWGERLTESLWKKKKNTQIILLFSIDNDHEYLQGTAMLAVTEGQTHSNKQPLVLLTLSHLDHFAFKKNKIKIPALKKDRVCLLSFHLLLNTTGAGDSLLLLRLLSIQQTVELMPSPWRPLAHREPRRTVIQANARTQMTRHTHART